MNNRHGYNFTSSTSFFTPQLSTLHDFPFYKYLPPWPIVLLSWTRVTQLFVSHPTNNKLVLYATIKCRVKKKGTHPKSLIIRPKLMLQLWDLVCWQKNVNVNFSPSGYKLSSIFKHISAIKTRAYFRLPSPRLRCRANITTEKICDWIHYEIWFN